MEFRPTLADAEIAECISQNRSFSLIAGAGSGKTTSLITTLNFIRKTHGKSLRQQGQKIVCITYTKRAVGVIHSKLGFDKLYHVSTLHSFLWQQISRFQNDIRLSLLEEILPKHIEKATLKDNGGNSRTAIAARQKVERLQQELDNLANVENFKYDDSVSSDYSRGILNHGDVIDIAAFLILNRSVLRKGIGFKFPYIFVDEAQDTFENVIEALNSICANEGPPLVGYFGDPMQQIYEKRAGDFSGPENARRITKTENFRCSTSVINLLNAFRDDVEQFPAGLNAGIEGSVHMLIVQAAEPEAPRRRYTDEQLDTTIAKFDEALKVWGWSDDTNVKRLFLVRQMIARRLKFSNFHKLYTGQYSSSKSQTGYESGEHYLLTPFSKFIVPLVLNTRTGDQKKVIGILRKNSPAFDFQGQNRQETLRSMLILAKTHSDTLSEMWESSTLKEFLLYIREHNLYKISDKLLFQLTREPRVEEYDRDNDEHIREKGDWLADVFFMMNTSELHAYCDFIDDNTALSTQHGVKGEEYKNVLVVFDDVEAAWSNYSFAKTLTPQTAGEPTDGQKDKSRKLAYVCFSRAEENLRILFFAQNAEAAKVEIVQSGLLSEEQIDIL